MEFCFPIPVQEAIERLRKAGHEAYAVGGCVRDTFLCKEPSDWDITTSALPEETMAVFEGERLITTGLKHGTVTLLLHDMPLEITTYRIDGDYTDHRRPDSVSFTPLLSEDLKRRDFTVNAMAVTVGMEPVDLFGGREDLQSGIIRAVGDPDTRFTEDALRILRGLRFASVLDFIIEEETAAAMERQKALLQSVSAERIFVELKKLLCGAGAERILLKYHSILGVVLPELLPMVGFDQHTPYHIYDIYTHTVKTVAATLPTPVLRLTMLFHDVGKPNCFALDEKGQGHFYGHAEESTQMAEAILRRLKCDKATLEQVCTLIQYHDVQIAETKASVRRWLNRLGEENFLLLMEVKIADNKGQTPSLSFRLEGYRGILDIYKEIIAEASCFSIKDLAVNGNDLIALGLVGKTIGKALQFLLEEVMEERCENNREALLLAVSRKFLED